MASWGATHRLPEVPGPCSPPVFQVSNAWCTLVLAATPRFSLQIQHRGTPRHPTAGTTTPTAPATCVPPPPARPPLPSPCAPVPPPPRTPTQRCGARHRGCWPSASLRAGPARGSHPHPGPGRPHPAATPPLSPRASLAPFLQRFPSGGLASRCVAPGPSGAPAGRGPLRRRRWERLSTGPLNAFSLISLACINLGPNFNLVPNVVLPHKTWVW